MSFVKLFYVLILLTFNNAIAQNKLISQNSDDINFTSDNLTLDEKTNIMTASGNVIIISDDRKIQADKVTYDKIKDSAVAIGNVVITDKDGSIHESKRVVLTNEFKSLLAIPLYSRFNDGSIITAKSLTKNNLGQSNFNEGYYTACECNIKEGETPIWRLESDKIRHDPVTKTIYFKHVKMKIFFIPVYYLPYMSQPDWTVRRRTGFLTPVYGYSKRDNFHTKIPYYFAPENDESWDMTFTSFQKGKRGDADQLNFRKKYEKTKIVSNIYKGNLNTNKSDGDDVFGANLFLSSKFGNNWSLSMEGKYSDEDTFMRNYGFDNDSIYKSFVKLEKSNQNSTSNIEFFNIENLDIDIDRSNQPVLAPLVSHHIFNSNVNFNYDVKLNAHSIYNDEYYDIKRYSSSGEINKTLRYNDTIFEGDATFGLDLYSIQGRPFKDKNKSKYIDRFSAGISVAASKEFYNEFQNFDYTLIPKIHINSTISPDKTNEIPNRDSSEYRLDEANLFLNNQYQGRDNIQQNHRINLGITSLFFTENFGDINFFIGQSQRIGGTNKNIKTTIEDRQSHIINSIDWNLDEKYNFSWFSLYNHHDLKSDLSDFVFSGKTKNGYEYIVNHSSINNSFVSNNEDREELKLGISKNFSNLKTTYSKTLNLSNSKEESTSESLEIEYNAGYMFQNCLGISLQYNSTAGSKDKTILSEDSISLTFDFKNLGNLNF